MKEFKFRITKVDDSHFWESRVITAASYLAAVNYLNERYPEGDGYRYEYLSA